MKRNDDVFFGFDSLQSAIIGCSLGGSPITDFLIDSGADVNVLSEADWRQLELDYEKGESILYDVTKKCSKAILAFASVKPLRVLASFNAWVDVPGGRKPRVFSKFFAVAGAKRSLLGRATAIEMRVLQIGLGVNSVEAATKAEGAREFPAIPGIEIDFDIDAGIPATKNAYYSVPAAFSARARERLLEMESQGIIERVTHAPKYISGMSAVPKGKNDFRLVVNMKGPNRSIRRQYHRLPVWNEIQRKLQGAVVFTKLDLKAAFHHVRLAKASRDITTFMTESGMYRFKRLVFGVNCAPEIFQRVMENILRDIPNVIIFIDDILIYGDTEDELAVTTEQVMSALRVNNLTLNEEKCEFNKRKVTFLGHELTAEGFNIDEKKVATIKSFREPRTTSELRSFLGMATYVSAYIPMFAELTDPLWRAATKKGFVWGPEQAVAFEKTKEAVASCTVKQGYFSDTDKTIVYTDASPNGLGAALVQV